MNFTQYKMLVMVFSLVININILAGGGVVIAGVVCISITTDIHVHPQVTICTALVMQLILGIIVYK